MTVHEVSVLTGVTERALRHYDRIGLLPPAATSAAGYRLYDEASLERLSAILLFRELQFPLKDIRGILDSPTFERNRALEQQVRLLELRREHLDNLIDLAKGMLIRGVKNLDFTAFDTRKLDEYAAEAKASWGTTAAYQEYEKKRASRTAAEERQIGEAFMELLAGFGPLRDLDPGSKAVRDRLARLRDYITEHFYTCTDDILRSLAALYAGDGRMAENIDNAGGPGTARFIADAIGAYCEGVGNRE